MRQHVINRIESVVDLSYTLKLIKRPNGRYYVRGSAYGEDFMKSLKTNDRATAEALAAQLFPRRNKPKVTNSYGWRAIEGFPGYKAHSSGAICGPRGVAKGSIKKTGYEYVMIRVGDKFKAMPVHRLICIAFHGVPTGAEMALHKNDRKSDNRAANLYWGLHRQNALDLKRNRLGGGGNTGSEYPLSLYNYRIENGKIIITARGYRAQKA